MSYRILPFLFIIVIAFAKCKPELQTSKSQLVIPQKGLVINTSSSFENGEFQILAKDDLNENILTIEGDSIVVDFNDLKLVGTDDFTQPETFRGTAIEVKNGKHITIKNLNVSGYRVALNVQNVQYLTIENCNFSYNYRRNLHSDIKSKSPQLGAVVMNASTFITIKNCTISNNQNGILFNDSKNIILTNSKIQFHSGVGIITDNATIDTLHYNQIDWNLGGISRQKNGGKIQSVNAYNSFTHNGLSQIDMKYFEVNDYTATDIIIDSKVMNYTLSDVDEQIPVLNPKYPKGEIYKFSTQFGVYNFEYPAIFLRNQEKDNQYIFAMFGPTVGNWKFVNAENVKATNLKRGSFPATFSLEKENPNQPFLIEFEFIGEAFQDEFGIWNKKGKIYTFGYSEL